MESRKYQLQKQIIEALKANDDNLYSLLRSQWAHRFGVESLEELKKLDLNQENQNPSNQDNQKIEQTEDCLFEDDKAIPTKDEDNQDKEISNDTDKVVESVEVENEESFVIKSYVVDKKKFEENAINSTKGNNKPSQVQALIPIPPKPKYGYMKKWLLRNRF